MISKKINYFYQKGRPLIFATHTKNTIVDKYSSMILHDWPKDMTGGISIKLVTVVYLTDVSINSNIVNAWCFDIRL